MSTTYLAMGVALVLALGLIVNIGILSLLSGAFHFLFGKPKIDFLKSTLGSQNGFAFAFKWDSSREPAKFNKFKLRLFNPFGSPTQVEIYRDFEGKSSDFALDLDLGDSLKQLLNAKGFEDALVQIELSSVEGICHQLEMKGRDFTAKRQQSTMVPVS